MGKLKRMDQVKCILEAYQDTGSIKGTARRLQISKNTVWEYVRRVWSHCDDVSQALVLPPEMLMEICYEEPRYILDLILSSINVSVQTVDIVEGMPKMEFEDVTLENVL